MQNFSPSNATAVGAGAKLLGAALEWATGRQPTHAPVTRPAVEPADTRPLMEIDARLAELLAIDVTEPRTRRDAGPDTAAFKPDSATAKDAARMLETPLAKAREWLASAKTVAELAEQGLAPSLVEKFLKRNADRFLQGYPART
jgi:hypothetical protein